MWDVQPHPLINPSEKVNLSLKFSNFNFNIPFNFCLILQTVDSSPFLTCSISIMKITYVRCIQSVMSISKWWWGRIICKKTIISSSWAQLWPMTGTTQCINYFNMGHPADIMLQSNTASFHNGCQGNIYPEWRCGGGWCIKLKCSIFIVSSACRWWWPCPWSPSAPSPRCCPPWTGCPPCCKSSLAPPSLEWITSVLLLLGSRVHQYCHRYFGNTAYHSLRRLLLQSSLRKRQLAEKHPNFW